MRYYNVKRIIKIQIQIRYGTFLHVVRLISNFTQVHRENKFVGRKIRCILIYIHNMCGSAKEFRQV